MWISKWGSNWRPLFAGCNLWRPRKKTSRFFLTSMLTHDHVLNANHPTAIFFVTFFLATTIDWTSARMSLRVFRHQTHSLFPMDPCISSFRSPPHHWNWTNAGQFRSFEAYTVRHPNQDRQGFPCESLFTEISLRFTQPRWWTYRLFAGMVGSYDQWLDKWAILIIYCKPNSYHPFLSIFNSVIPSNNCTS